MSGPEVPPPYVNTTRYGGAAEGRFAIFNHIPPAFVDNGSIFAFGSVEFTFTQKVMVHGEARIKPGTL